MFVNIGIIAGSGELPIEIARAYKKLGGFSFIAVISDLIYLDKFEEYTYKKFFIGEIGAILDFFSTNNVKEIILAGSIIRPDIYNLKVDKVGLKLVKEILKQKFFGDDNLLKICSNFIENYGFTVISPHKILNDAHEINNLSTKSKPSKQDKIDIELGKLVLFKLGDVDVGQSVIVCNGRVLGIEADEGTDNLIKRCVSLRSSNSGGVLIKMSKLYQDLRLDTPTVGSDTILNLANCGFNGIALEKGNVIMVNYEITFKLANENKLFISEITYT